MTIPKGEDLSLRSLGRELIADTNVKHKDSPAYWIKQHALGYIELASDDERWYRSVLRVDAESHEADIRTGLVTTALATAAASDHFSETINAVPALRFDPIAAFKAEMDHNGIMLDARSRLSLATYKLGNFASKYIISVADEESDRL